MNGEDLVRRRIQVAFGRRLQRVRQEKGRKQASLAQHLGMSRTSVSNLERGVHRLFLDTVYQAAKFLQVDISELLPSFEEVFEEALISSPVDDRLSADIERQLAEVVRQVQNESAMTSASRSRSRE